MTPFRRQAGFTVVELLFAIGSLSIGLIGVAAALYTGIDQTQASFDANAAAALARQASATLTQVMTRQNTDETGLVYSPVDATHLRLLEALRGEQISNDGRYAWVPLYRRLGGADTAEVLIVVARAGASSRFTSSDLATPSDDARPPNLVPAQASVQISDGELILMGAGDAAQRLAPGAVVVLNHTGMAGGGSVNGRVVRLAGPSGAGGWTLEPGQDLADLPGLITANHAYVVGRGYADAAHPSEGFAGPSQAVAVYATIIQLR